MAVALIVAAGRGERLGSGGPKALAALAGRPMLRWSVDALLAVPAVRRIVVALPDGHLDAAPESTIGVVGGASRSASVRAALGAAFAPAGTEGSDTSVSVDRDEAVIVHDAARALAEPALFEAALEELERTGADAVIAAVPVTDTIKQVTDDDPRLPGAALTVTRTLERANLWSVQTPQVFRRSVLERALAATDEMLAAATDDAWLVEQQGGVVAVLAAPPENFKITTSRDLRIADLILSERLSAGAGR